MNRLGPQNCTIAPTIRYLSMKSRGSESDYQLRHGQLGWRIISKPFASKLLQEHRTSTGKPRVLGPLTESANEISSSSSLLRCREGTKVKCKGPIGESIASWRKSMLRTIGYRRSWRRGE
jgi:hypothetical protein